MQVGSRDRCAACGDPCPAGQRWCSTSCFQLEDRYDDDDWEEQDDE